MFQTINKSRSKFKWNTLAITLAISALAITSCSTDGGVTTLDNKSEASSATENLPKVTGEAGVEPVIEVPATTPPTSLMKADLIMGTGAEVLATSTLTVHYSLVAWSTGQKIETSWGGEPATFPLSGVITGWQEGIPGMKVGGRRLLVLPPDMAYGAAGSGPVGPNETLIFVVDVVAVS